MDMWSKVGTATRLGVVFWMGGDGDVFVVVADLGSFCVVFCFLFVVSCFFGLVCCCLFTSVHV